MKVICDCGAKYAFDATADNLRNPFAFSCPGCGLDLSARMNEMLREQFAPVATALPMGDAPALEIAPPPPGAIPVAPTTLPPSAPRLTLASSHSAPAAPETPAPESPPAPTAAPVVRIHRSGHTPAAAPTEAVKDTRFCSKHPQVRVTEKCVVCGKGICPKCMVLFGYVCSPHCKEKADLQGIEVPKFAGQRDAVESKRWAKIGLVAKLAALFIILVVGLWVWYAWFGSHPKPFMTLRFENESAISGMSAVCEGQQMIFLHGAKLGRLDLKSKKEVWLQHIVDVKKLSATAESEIKEMQAEEAKGEGFGKIPSLESLVKDMTKSAERSLQLRVHGKNIWVADGEKARRFDWDSGAQKDEVDFSGDFSEAVLHDNELEFREPLDATRMNVTRFNLASGKISSDEIGEKPVAPPVTNAPTKLAAAAKGKGTPATTPTSKPPMTAQQLGAAVAGGSMAGKLAAPATISVARRQQEAIELMEEMDAMNESSGRVVMSEAELDKLLFAERSELIPLTKGFALLTTKMTEKNITSRSAAKAAPKKSALDGPVNAAATMDIANELLNEMSRNAGGDIVREDHSKYHVKVHRGGGVDVPDWEGDVVGPPELYPQPTVNVLAAGTTLIVLDAQNKKKWESTLMYPVAGSGTFLDFDQAEQHGLGPVVERGDTLYVYDQGVLSAFDLATGNARWRLPSVGITGMYFDADGRIYLNTTTASPDKIKYSRQIDVNDSTSDIVLKLDPQNGKEIWKHSMGGRIAYLSGKYIYTLSYTPPRDDDDEYDENLAALGLESKPYIRIRRINPKNGRVMWDHYQPRGALDIQIHDNVFQLVLKKEVQVMKFLSF